MSNDSFTIDIFELFDFFVPLSVFEWIVSLTVFPFLSILYIVVLYVVYKNKSHDYANPYYTMLFGNGICDIGMLIYTIYTIINDTAQKHVLGKSIDNIIGYVFYWSLGWYGVQIFGVLIASNRLIAIVWNHKYKSIEIKHARYLVFFGVLTSLVIPLPIAVDPGFGYLSIFKVGFNNLR